ncbi:MAG: lipase family alpha/beta hydrolase, partial [Microgenomates group bacterium]
ILHNQSVGVFDWKLLPFVKEYNGIIGTFKNLGYQENQDFFVFPYDWRKSVEKSSEDLKTFINTKIPQDQKVNLIGHSLGGLVARIFTQKYKEKVNKIITVGSPHEGAVQVYKPLSAGEIDRENNFLWLAQKIILLLNKSQIEPDRETIRKRFPVAFDLFPTFNFLKNKNGEEISINNLSIKNNLLNQYNQNLSEIFPQFIAFYGEKDNQTPAGYIVDPPNIFHKTLGNYQDGQPIDIFYDYGDYTVLSKSANKDSDSQKLLFDHGEIITEKQSIKKILSALDLYAEDGQIINGNKTTISPSLIFFIKSPAEMVLQLPDSTFINEYEGMIFVENAQFGNYHLQIQGKEKGKYTLLVGQINSRDDLWETKEGEIIKDPPESQIETYPFNFNQEKLTYIFPTPTPTPTINPSITPTPSPTSTNNQKITPTSNPNQNTVSSQNNTSSSNQSQSNNQGSNQILGESTIIISPRLISYSTKNKKNMEKHKPDILGVKNKFKKESKTEKIENNSNHFNKIIFILFLFLLISIIIYTKKIKNFKNFAVGYLERIKNFIKKIQKKLKLTNLN